MPRKDDETGIEITEAMVEAGARELWRFNLDYDSHEDGARRIYEAMFALIPPPARRAQPQHPMRQTERR